MTRPKPEAWIDEMLEEYENGQNPHQSEEYRLNKAKALITAKLKEVEIAGRINELQNSFREFSKDVPFDERLKYYDDRFAELNKIRDKSNE